MDETSAMRRAVFYPTVLMSFKDRRGKQQRIELYCIVRQGHERDLGTPFPAGKSRQEILDEFGWRDATETQPGYPVDFDDPAPELENEWKQKYGEDSASLKEKRLAYSVKDIERACATTEVDVIRYEVYGAYVDEDAFAYMYEELRGVVDHEKGHVIFWSRVRDEAESFERNLVEEIQEQSQGTGWYGHFCLIYEHARLELLDILNPDRSYKSLVGRALVSQFGAIREPLEEDFLWYNKAVRAFLKGRSVYCMPGHYVAGMNIKSPSLSLSTDVKMQVKEKLREIYRRMLDKEKGFPELRYDREFFHGALRLLPPE